MERPSKVGSPVPPVQRNADTSRACDPTLTFAAREIVGPPPPPIPGLGRYRIVRAIAEGGFGRVLLARDETLQRDVVVKLPRHPAESRDTESDPFLVEARVVASLEHPHIGAVYDVGRTSAGQYYIVSRFLEGESLAVRMRNERLPWRVAADLVAKIADALHHAHQHGVVHRDVKPDNILLDRAGRPYLTDFGLALQESAERGESGYWGTPAYMSPEQARGESHRLDGRSDVFSLGIVFYELLAGRRPFRASTIPDLLAEIRAANPKPPRQTDDGIPVELERVVLRMLARNPLERYSTAKDVADDVRRFLAGPSLESPRPPPDRRVRLLVGFIASVACAVLLVVLGAAFAARQFLFPAPAERAELSGQITNPDAAKREASMALPPSPVPTPAPLGFPGDLPIAPGGAEVRPPSRGGTASSTKIASPNPTRELRGHSGPVRSLSFSPDGSRLASGSDDQTVRLWQVGDGEAVETIRDCAASVNGVAFSPDGHWLAWGGDGVAVRGIEILHVARRERRQLAWSDSQPTAPHIRSIAFSPDAKRVAAGGSGPVRVWDVESGNLWKTLPWQETFPSYAYGVAFSSEGRFLAAGCHGGGDVMRPDTVRVWELERGDTSELLVGSSQAFGLAHDDVRAALAFSTQGLLLARVTSAWTRFPPTSQATLSVWDLANKNRRTDFDLPGGTVFAMQMGSRGAIRAASASGRPQFGVHLFGTATASPTQVSLFATDTKTTQSWETGHAAPILAIAFSRDGQTLATASEDATIRLWKLAAP